MKIIRSTHENFSEYWSTLFEESDFQHPLYQPGNISYYKAASSGIEFEDRSFVIEEGKKPILGVLAAINVYSSGSRELGGWGIMPVFFIEDAFCQVGKLSGAYKLLKQELDEILNNFKINRISYQDFLSAGKLSFVGKYLLNNGAIATPFFTQILDLTDSELNLEAQIRKSYKSLINWGEKNLVLRVLDKGSVSAKDIESFRKLHIIAAGRETRPRTTWDLQHEMIKRNEAFAVFGELEGELVTAALFPCSKKYCFYGVSASKRELFNKPLSHAVVWKALLHAKKNGCHYFESGMQCYPRQGGDACSPKDLNISVFKHGFGGQTCVRLNIVWDIDKAAGKEAEG